MKKIKFIILVLVLVAVYPCFSKETEKTNNQSIGLSLSLGTIQDFLLNYNSTQFSLDIRYMPDKTFEFRLPFTFTRSEEENFLDAGLFVCYYPFTIQTGFYVGISVVHFGCNIGLNAENANLIPLNEMVIGWNITLPLGIFLEPSVSIRDPSGTFTDEYSELKGAFSSYGTFRPNISIGWKYNF